MAYIKNLKQGDDTIYPITHVEAVINGNGDSIQDIMGEFGKIPQVNGTVAASVTIDPYKLYNFGTVSQTMVIVFNTEEEIDGYANEYIIRFVAGANCNITLPSGVLYNGGTPPTYTSGRTYEIDIVNNCAAVAEFY